MVTAPLLTAGIKVNLPESTSILKNEKNDPKFAFENYSEAIKWLLQMVETNYYQGEQRKIVLEKINSYLNKLEYLKENNDLKNKK